MGLDMYFEREHYVQNWDHYLPEQRWLIIINGPEAHQIQPKRVTRIVEEIAYWRKANQIHAWFVDNVQNGNDDCERSYVEGSQVKELLGLCRQVLADHSMASELLPTRRGFFFGGLDYDEYYFAQLEYTVEQLSNLPEGDYYYNASW